MKYSMGVDELDELIGELDPGTMLLIEGVPGAGKTSLALSIAYTNITMNNSRVLYLTLGETPDKLLSIAVSLGFKDIEKYVRGEMLKITKIPFIGGVEVAEYATKILSEAANKYDVIVIDSVTPLAKVMLNYKDRRAWIQVIYDHVSKLKNNLVVLVADIMDGRTSDEELRVLEYVSDIVIELDYRIYETGLIERIMKIKKYRGKSLKVVSIPFLISSSGIKILNYVSRGKIVADRGENITITIDCGSLEKLVGSKYIESGTQILVIDKRRWIHGSHFLNYLVYLIAKLLAGNRVVKITSFSSEVLREFKNIIDSNPVLRKYNSVFKSAKIYEYDPRSIQLHYMLGEHCIPSLIKGVDLCVVLGAERLLYIYGSDVIKKTVINMIENMKLLKTTAIRYLRIKSEDYVPDYYIEFHDIVIVIEPLRNGAITVKLLKNLRVNEPISIPDIAFRECIR